MRERERETERERERVTLRVLTSFSLLKKLKKTEHERKESMEILHIPNIYVEAKFDLIAVGAS